MYCFKLLRYKAVLLNESKKGLLLDYYEDYYMDFNKTLLANQQRMQWGVVIEDDHL